MLKANANWNKNQVVELLVIFFVFLLSSFLLYSKGLNAPWYLDDYPAIVNNESLRNVWLSLDRLFSPRGVSFLSFSLNFNLFGEGPASFHVVNVLLHGINSFLVYVFLRTLVDGPRFAILGAAAIFLCHPVQSQTVTYVVQRMALLSCFFVLITILAYCMYIKCEKSKPFTGKRVLWCSLCILSGVLAIYSKENVALFPIVLLLYDWFLSRHQGWSIREGLKRSWFFFLIPAFVVFKRFLVQGSDVPGVSSDSKIPFFLSVDAEPFSKIVYDVDFISLKYFMTQCWVLLKYLKLVILPFNQVFDYCYPLITRLSDLRFITGLLIIIIVVIVAFCYRKRFPIIMFGVSFFFLTQAVESSFIPLDPVFEHRMYLPLVGLVAIFTKGIQCLPPRVGKILIIVIVLFLSVTTVNRVELWASPSRLWSDNVEKVPDAPRPQIWLARALFDEQQFDEAIKVLEKVMPIYHEKPDLSALVTLGESYFYSGRKEEAYRLFQDIQQQYPYENSIDVYSGLESLTIGEHARAQVKFSNAINRNPNDIRPVYYLGVLYEKTGQYEKALEAYSKAGWKPFHRSYLLDINVQFSSLAQQKHGQLLLKIESQLEQLRQKLDANQKNLQLRGEAAIFLQKIGAYDEAISQYLLLEKVAGPVWQLSYNLALIYEIQRKFRLAEERFQQSVALNPSNSTILNSYGVFSRKYGDLSFALGLFEKAASLDPSYGFAHFNLADTYFRLGKKEKAREAFLAIQKKFPALMPSASEYLQILAGD